MQWGIHFLVSDALPLILVFIVLSILLRTLLNKYRRFVGKVDNLYIDKGRSTPVLYSKTYHLSGKPDAIIRDQYGDIACVEYKSRTANIYESDIVQVKAASLIARENGYNVKYAIVKTRQQSHRIALPRKDSDLYHQIKSYIAIVQDARNNQPVPAIAHPIKCRYCGYKARCPSSAAYIG